MPKVVDFNREKFKSLVLYACWKAGDTSRLGATKLNKILWFSDLMTYLNLDAPVTGARYIKRQFGPVPSNILPVMEELKAEGKLVVRDTEHFGKPKRDFFPMLYPALGDFSADEISIVDGVIDQICKNHTADSISRLTHNRAWELAEIGEELPMFTVFARRGEIDETDIQWADEQIASLVAA